MDNPFLPGRDNGRGSRARIQARLAVSVAHICEQCSGHILFDEEAARALVDLLNSPARVRPSVFGDYFALIGALQSHQQDEETVRQGLDRLLSRPFEAGEGIDVRPLLRSHFTQAEEDRLRDQFVSESLVAEQIGRLDDSTAARQVGRVGESLALIAEHAPRSHAEMQQVIAEIVLARDAVGAGETELGACSSLERWGSMLINCDALESPLLLAEALMHEAAHSYLYGASPVEFHVRNPIAELYKSPLRADPRPMDGIYHATFVLARTCFSMNEFAASETLEPEMRGDARDRAGQCRQLFEEGYAVLVRHADYTDEGRAIMAAAHEYMASLEAPVSA